MLPGFLESTYKRYKNDTSVFIKWLYEAGSRCGYVTSEPIKPRDETPAKAPRLKGKARKQAKEAASNGEYLYDNSHENPISGMLEGILWDIGIEMGIFRAVLDSIRVVCDTMHTFYPNVPFV